MEQLYGNYFESMPCFLTVQDRDLRIVHANRRFMENFGEIEGRYCYQVYKRRPEKCESCPVERSFRDGRSHTSEERVRTLDGREVDVIVNSTPIRDERGKITSVMEMSTDITEIKGLQERLRESQEKYRVLFDQVPCFISIQDRELRIVEANRQHREAFGTAYGAKCYEVYKHRPTECQPCLVRKTFEDGEVRTHEEVVTSRDDERINVLVRTSPVHNGEGEIEQVLEVSTDITEIRRLQDKLASVGLLIGSISHGIKGLLNGLDGGIYLVDSGLKKDDRGRIDRGWEIAMRNVDRIRSMVMDILYYAKDRVPEWESLSAVEVLDEVCELVKGKAEKLGIEFTREADPGAGAFEADPMAFRSLLTNLLENAIDACRVDRKKDRHAVRVCLRCLPDHLIFEVSDNGIGMDRETAEKAFSLFFSSKGAGGTGLGLFIANKIARAHGGRIEIESAEGKGSVFRVRMPRTRPPEGDIHEPEEVNEQGERLESRADSASR